MYWWMRCARFTRLCAIGIALFGSSDIADAGEATVAETPIVELGRTLFFDPRLSGDASLSCATCHDPETAFVDQRQFSRGYPGTEYFRNTPTLLNVSRRRFIYWDGRLSGSDLPTVVRDHLAEGHFMNADGRLLIERVRQVPAYREMFQSAFAGEPSYGRILNSLAAFIETLETEPAPFDHFLAGDDAAISDEAKHGWELFQGKAGCISCHAGDDFTDEAFHNLGLGDQSELFASPERHFTFRRFLRTLGVSQFDHLRHDPGRWAITKRPAEESLFRTPTLRMVSQTAPYMHDGRFATLEDVIDFYDAGSGDEPGRDEHLSPVNLTDDEKAALVAFLHSLGDDWPLVEAVDPPPYDVQPLPSVAIASSEIGSVAPLTGDEIWPPLAALPAVPVPADNPITPEKSELGRLLFFDPRLSGDGSTSCATCHEPSAGWGDGQAISLGYPGTEHWRNSQTCINTGYLVKLFWAGESTSLESQAKSAIEGNLAGNIDGAMVEERLKQIPDYVERFQDVFGVDEPTYPLVLRAIATFERAELNSTDSPFDNYMRGDESALGESELRGMELFQGKAHCIRCHNGPLLTDESYHALGVPDLPLFESSPLHQISLRYQHVIRGVSEPEFREAHTDFGLYYSTQRESDRGRFRTPPLRYLRFTAPYMHNGVFNTLAEVIDFYDEGGGASPHQSPLLMPLGLTGDEKQDLEAFLLSLSGSEILIEYPELPPYQAIE